MAIADELAWLRARVDRCAPGTPRPMPADVASYYTSEAEFWRAIPRYAFFDFFLAPPEQVFDRTRKGLPPDAAIVGPPPRDAYESGYSLAYRTGRGSADGPIEVVYPDQNRFTYPSYLQLLTHCVLIWTSWHASTGAHRDVILEPFGSLVLPSLSALVHDAGDGVLLFPLTRELEPPNTDPRRVVYCAEAPNREILAAWLVKHRGRWRSF